MFQLTVHGDDRGEPEDVHEVVEVAQQVRQAAFERGEVFMFEFVLREAAVHLQRTDRSRQV